SQWGHPMIRRRNQDGLTAVLVTLLLTGLCGAAAMAVDVGVLYSARTSAQSAADAAALAGAFTFLKPANAQPTTGTNAAIAMAKANSILGSAAVITSSDVTVDQADQRV